MEIKPIETEYNGYRFRSRLEARWAVAFDAMGIEYEYEPEGYVLGDGTLYLPDFRLLNIRHRSYDDEYEPIYVEVKGILSDFDRHKLEMFPYPIVLIGQLPDRNGIPIDEDDSYWSFCYMDGDSYPGAFSEYRGEIWFCGEDHDQFTSWDLMKKGAEAAKRSRFEHGEKG